MNSEEARNQFSSLLQQLMESMSQVFPECQNTKLCVDIFNLKKNSVDFQTMLITEWHANLASSYVDISKRKVEKLKNLNFDMFKMLNIRGKWDDPDFDDESRQIFFEYIHSMNHFANLYCTGKPLGLVLDPAPSISNNNQNSITGSEIQSLFDTSSNAPEDDAFDLDQNELLEGIPQDVLKSVKDAMSSMFSGVADGEDFDPSKIDFGTMVANMQRLTESISPESMAQMQQNIPTMMKNFQKVTANPEIMDLVGNMSKNVNIPGMPAGMNPTDLLGMMGNLGNLADPNNNFNNNNNPNN